MKTWELAEALAARIGVELPAEEVWLFGSLARGEAGPDSDMDFLVVVGESDRPGHHRSRDAHALAREIRVPKDIVVLTRKQWSRQENVVNTLPYLAKKEGRLLYHQ
ncbi:MAG: nucleotidyltransferase domain-containing protein [Terrimicrobiaceae bacterium]